MGSPPHRATWTRKSTASVLGDGEYVLDRVGTMEAVTPRKVHGFRIGFGKFYATASRRRCPWCRGLHDLKHNANQKSMKTLWGFPKIWLCSTLKTLKRTVFDSGRH